MIDVAWAIVRNNDRYLLAQRSTKDPASGAWCFPSSNLKSIDPPSDTAAKELQIETGLVASGSREICETRLGDYNVHIIECTSWSGKPYPANQETIGIGWFTIPEIWNLGHSLVPFLAKILPQFTFLMRHTHPYGDYRKDDATSE